MVTREFFRRWGEYRRLICELNSYSDAELAELGMARSASAPDGFRCGIRQPAGRFEEVVPKPSPAGERRGHVQRPPSHRG